MFYFIGGLMRVVKYQRVSTTKQDYENQTNSKLVSALLFMLHISSEIVKSFTYGDDEDSKELLDEAIVEANFAYKNKNGLDLQETLNKARMN